MNRRAPTPTTDMVRCWYCRATVVPHKIETGDYVRLNVNGSEHLCPSNRRNGDANESKMSVRRSTTTEKRRARPRREHFAEGAHVVGGTCLKPGASRMVRASSTSPGASHLC